MVFHFWLNSEMCLFPQGNFHLNSGLLIPAANWSHKSTSNGPSNLRIALQPYNDIPHSFIRFSDQSANLRPFDQFELGRSAVLQKCFLNFCD